MNRDLDRRSFLLAAASLSPLMALSGCTTFRAARAAMSGGPKANTPANLNQETSQLLEYVHELPADHALKSSQACSNCKYYKGDIDSNWGPCPLIPSGWVSAKGWCNVWKAKS